VMVADPIVVAGMAVTSCRVLACLSFVRKRMGAKGALACTSAAAGTADGGLRQASPRGHERDECSPCLARVGEERRRRCMVTGVFWVVDSVVNDVVTGVVTDVLGAARQRWKWSAGGRWPVAASWCRERWKGGFL